MDTSDFCHKTMDENPQDSPAILTSPIDALDYNMDHKYRGFCLILNHETFARRQITSNLAPRTSSRIDADACANLFTKLGFEVHELRDAPVSKVIGTLKTLGKANHSDMDCFVCVVLTHGDHGHLFAHDGRYAIDHLFNPFLGDRCPTLVGKPKLFFLQACQGSRMDRGVLVSASTDALDSAHYFRIPTYADFLIAYSTLPGFYSFRNTEKGSWFIQALVKVLRDSHRNFDLLSMMTLVSQYVAYNFTSIAASPSQSGMKQVPCITSMLTRRVYFKPKGVVI